MTAQSTERHREYVREWRRRQRQGEGGLGGGPPPPADGQVSVAQATEDERASMPAASAMPALRALCRVLAECLDDPTERRHHPAAAGQLRAALGEVRSAQVPDGRSRLHATRAAVT